DPVAKVSYTLHPDTRTAEKQARMVVLTEPTVQHPVAGKSFYFVNGNPSQIVTFNPVGSETPKKAESLGTRQIEGVMANGTRTTSTIPAGSIRNERPIDRKSV